MLYEVNIPKNGELQVPLSMIEKMDNGLKQYSELYAALCIINNQITKIRFSCIPGEVKNIIYTGSLFELGDIAGDWEMVKEELKMNKLPEKWYSLLEGAKMIPEKAMNENQNVTETEQKEDIEEDTEEDTEQSAEFTESKEENVKQPENTAPLADSGLPQISGDFPAVLVKSGKYQLNMQICGDKATMLSDGCKLYLTNTETGQIYISGSSEITISKAKLLSATDHSVMNVLSNFLVNFTEDDKKMAFERGKRYLEAKNNITYISSSRNIQEIFFEVVEYAKGKALEAIENGGLSDDYKYNEAENTVAIISNQFQKVLDEVDAGCTKTVFCKKLRLIERHYRKTIIITNRGGSGYGFNDTNNKRYYKFNAVSFDIRNKEI